MVLQLLGIHQVVMRLYCARIGLHNRIAVYVEFVAMEQALLPVIGYERFKLGRVSCSDCESEANA